MTHTPVCCLASCCPATLVSRAIQATWGHATPLLGLCIAHRWRVGLCSVPGQLDWERPSVVLCKKDPKGCWEKCWD